METMLEIDSSKIKSEADVEHLVDQIVEEWNAVWTNESDLFARLYATFESLRFREHGNDGAPQSLSNKVACKSECSWCCYMNVEIWRPELDFILYAIKQLPPIRQAMVRVDAAEIAKHHYTLPGRIRSKTPCPFLHEKKCSIYPARPYVCRVHHSTSAKVCKADLYDCTDKALENNQLPEIVSARALLLRAALKILEMRGADYTTQELSIALDAALNHKKPELAAEG